MEFRETIKNWSAGVHGDIKVVYIGRDVDRELVYYVANLGVLMCTLDDGLIV